MKFVLNQGLSFKTVNVTVCLVAPEFNKALVCISRLYNTTYIATILFVLAAE